MSFKVVTLIHLLYFICLDVENFELKQNYADHKIVLI